MREKREKVENFVNFSLFLYVFVFLRFLTKKRTQGSTTLIYKKIQQQTPTYISHSLFLFQSFVVFADSQSANLLVSEEYSQKCAVAPLDPSFH
jgi:hypothetical protein